MDGLTVERLERVERQCDELRRQARRWKRAGGLALLGALVLMIGGAGEDPPRTVEANRFLLRDREGKVRARLDADFRGVASLTVMDAEQKPRFSVNVGRDGKTALSFLDFDAQDVPFQSIRMQASPVASNPKDMPYLRIETRYEKPGITLPPPS